VKTLNQFNKLAVIYDQLAGLIFGKSIEHAQIRFFDCLPHAGHVLILGGGTGWILKRLFAVRPELVVTYIEASDKMIELARKQAGHQAAQVKFIHGALDDIHADNYSVVITNFFLDLFTESELKILIAKLRHAGAKDFKWFATDFVSPVTTTHKILLKVMYLFFKVTCNIHARELPEWQIVLQNNGFRQLRSEAFYQNFIHSTVYVNE
jgi:tRNA (cmo5U34)-methyltransferase